MRLDPPAMMAEINARLKQHPAEHQLLVSELLFRQFSIDRVRPGWKYQTYSDLMFDLGTIRQAPLFVPDEPGLEPLQYMELGDCFRNAYDGAIDLGLQYVEGYACTSLLGVPHAWLEDEHGTVIDPTWAHLDLADGVIPTYCGIKFSRHFLLEEVLRSGWFSVLDRDWANNNAALRHGFITDDQGIVIARNTNEEPA